MENNSKNITEICKFLEIDLEKLQINDDNITLSYHGCFNGFNLLNLQEYNNQNNFPINFTYIEDLDISYISNVENFKGLESLETVKTLTLFDTDIKTTKHLENLKTVTDIIKIYHCDYITDIENLKKFKNLEVIECKSLNFSKYPIIKRIKNSNIYRYVLYLLSSINILNNKNKKYGKHNI